MKTVTNAIASLLLATLSLSAVLSLQSSHSSPSEFNVTIEHKSTRPFPTALASTGFAVPEHAARVIHTAPKRVAAVAPVSCTHHTLSQGVGRVIYCDTDFGAIAAVTE
jgi:hypothetical protein